MTVLLSKTDRVYLGIDTIERSIVYALLALRQVNADGANKEAVQVTLSANAATDAINATLSGQAKLYYNSPTALTGGFNLLEAITPYGSETLAEFESFWPTPGLEEEIPEEPATVETLEQFLLWCALILSASTHPLSLNYVKFSVFESADPPNLSIAFSLPLDYGKFLLTGNWIESVQKVFDFHITDPDQLISPWTIPPSQQFWGDPVDDLTALSALTGQAVGNTRWVHSEESFYSLLAELPVGETLDGLVYVAGEADTVWRKGGIKGDPGDPGIDGVDGNDGAPGLSAYQIAVAAGFVGSEADWLDSLVGPTGPAGNDGADGIDGDSAYEIAVANGFVGTEAEWLDSLIGEPGPAGADGLPGAGVDWRGAWNSATAYLENDAVSYNGSAYIANASNTNKTPGTDPEWDLWVAKGEPGADGADGGGHVIQDDGAGLIQRANLNFKGFKLTDDSVNDASIIQIAETLTDKALYYYDATSKLLKPIGIGSDGQALIAKPLLDPPYQFATPSGGGGGREVLTANRTYYVRTDGSDSNDGLSNTAGGAFLTPQKFADVAATLDRGIYSITGRFAAGTYSMGSGFLAPKDGVGDGDILYLGDISNPENVIFTGTNSDGVIQAYGSNKWQTFQGIKFTNTNNGHIFNVQYASKVRYKNCDFGSVGTGWHIVCANAGIVSNASTPSKITASASGHLLLFSAGFAEFVLATLTVQNTPTWSAHFASVNNASQLNWYNAVVSGSSNGSKYRVSSGATISNSGEGANLAGSSSGTSSGGYVT